MTIFVDRAKETTTTTGASDLVLLGASAGYQALPGSTTEDIYYCIVHTSADEWEVGIGNASTGSLVRGTILDGTSGAGVAVSFSAGTKDVFCTVPASVFDAAMGGRPSGNAEATTANDTPTNITAYLLPEPDLTGGLRFIFVRYAVVAYKTAGGVEMKAWEGTVFYRDGSGSTDTPTVIHDPDTTGWTIAASISSGNLVVSVVGEAAANTFWKVSATSEISREVGV